MNQTQGNSTVQVASRPQLAEILKVSFKAKVLDRFPVTKGIFNGRTYYLPKCNEGLRKFYIGSDYQEAPEFPRDWLTATEAGRMFDRSPLTILRLTRLRRIPFYHFGERTIRLRRGELQRWIAGGKSKCRKENGYGGVKGGKTVQNLHKA